MPVHVDAGAVEDFRLRLRQAVCEMILSCPEPWVMFCTFTFQTDVHPERAIKLFRVWTMKLNRDLYGPRFWKHPAMKGLLWVLAVERTKNWRVHLHAIIGGNDAGKVHRLRSMELWEKLGGGFARVEKMRTVGAAAAYCTKYVLKEDELTFSPTFWHVLKTRRARGELVDRSIQHLIPALAEPRFQVGRVAEGAHSLPQVVIAGPGRDSAPNPMPD